MAGGYVTLPCSSSIKASDDFPTVEWSKEGLQPNVVFLYRNGCETPEMKNPAFRYRTSLIVKELNNGNLSLRISNVQLSDAGSYRCMRLWRTAPRVITTVELVVGAVTEPKLSVWSTKGGGVTLQCSAHCWLPEPEVSFLDEQGNDIGGDKPKRDKEARGCFSVRRRATFRDAGERVTCRVHQRDINQTREVEVLLPVVRRKSCVLTAGVAVGTTLLLVAAGGIIVVLRKRFRKSAEAPSSPSSSNHSAASGSSEARQLLVSVRVGGEDERPAAIEVLRAELEELRLKLGQREDAILRLRTDREAPRVVHGDASASLPAAAARNATGRRRSFVRQSSNPVRGPSPAHRANRRHSEPAPLPRPSGSRGRRSSGALAPGPGARLPWSRSSAGFPAMANNPYSHLGNVAEDSEMLIA